MAQSPKVKAGPIIKYFPLARNFMLLGEQHKLPDWQHKLLGEQHKLLGWQQKRHGVYGKTFAGRRQGMFTANSNLFWHTSRFFDIIDVLARSGRFTQNHQKSI